MGTRTEHREALEQESAELLPELRAGDPETPTEHYRRLAIAVVTRALEDVGIIIPERAVNGGMALNLGKTEAERALVIRDAVLFLTSPDAGWAATRSHWCDAADINPDVMRERVLKLIPDRCREVLAAAPLPPRKRGRRKSPRSLRTATKLTEEQVKEIYLSAPVRARDLAERYSVSKDSITRIRRGVIFRDILRTIPRFNAVTNVRTRTPRQEYAHA